MNNVYLSRVSSFPSRDSGFSCSFKLTTPKILPSKKDESHGSVPNIPALQLLFIGTSASQSVHSDNIDWAFSVGIVSLSWPTTEL